MRPRKAQGISVNVIIIAAIALVVMVILIALVLNTGQTTNRAANSCEGLPGEYQQDWRCAYTDLGETCAGFDMIKHPSRGCLDSAPEQPLTCCFKII